VQVFGFAASLHFVVSGRDLAAFVFYLYASHYSLARCFIFFHDETLAYNLSLSALSPPCHDFLYSSRHQRDHGTGEQRGVDGVFMLCWKVQQR
jgi:hypothetical protein